MLLVKCGKLVTSTALCLLINVLFAYGSPQQQGVILTPQNPQQLLVIDARQPLTTGLLNNNLPLPIGLQQALTAISSAPLPHLLSGNPNVFQVLPNGSPAQGLPTLSEAVVSPLPQGTLLPAVLPLSQPLGSPHVVTLPHVQQLGSIPSAIPTQNQPLASVQSSSVAQGQLLDSTQSAAVVGSTQSAIQTQTQTSFPSTTTAKTSIVNVSQVTDITSNTPISLIQETHENPISLSALIPIPNVIAKAISSTQQVTNARTSSSEGNKDSTLSLSQDTTTTSTLSRTTEKLISSTTPPEVTTSSVPVVATTEATTESTSTTTITSATTESTSTSTTTAATAVTSLPSSTPAIDVATVSSQDTNTSQPTAIQEDAISQAAEKTTESVNTSTSSSSTVSSGSVALPTQQRKLSQTEFSARTGAADVTIAESSSNVEQETTESADTAANDQLSSNPIRDSIMPSAEEVTARRLATIARLNSTSSTAVHTEASVTSTTTATTTTTTTAPTTTVSPTTTSSSSTIAPASNIITTAKVSNLPAGPNNVNSLAKFFQNISRAAARNVAQAAALARSQRQNFDVKPIVVGTAAEGNELNEVVGVVHQGTGGLHMTISSAAEQELQHRQVVNHQDLVTEMIGTEAASSST